MNAEHPGARTSIRLARIRLEGWLSLHPPHSIPDYVDRVFARTVQVPDSHAVDDLASLLIDRDRILDLLLAELRVGAVCSHLVDALRLTWLCRRHGIPDHGLESVVEPLVERFEAAADAWAEPERSDFFYWAGRLDWADSRPSYESEGTRPLCDMAALLRQCDYGEQAISRAQAILQAGLLRAVEETDPPAMLLAGTLWVETAIEPVSPGMQERMANRLITLQEPDGGFPGSSRHRASCLALVALSRVQGILLRERNLG